MDYSGQIGTSFAFELDYNDYMYWLKKIPNWLNSAMLFFKNI